jgi:hypothetical protein
MWKIVFAHIFFIFIRSAPKNQLDSHIFIQKAAQNSINALQLVIWLLNVKKAHSSIKRPKYVIVEQARLVEKLHMNNVQWPLRLKFVREKLSVKWSIIHTLVTLFIIAHNMDQYCPEGTSFSTKTKTCDASKNAKCARKARACCGSGMSSGCCGGGNQCRPCGWMMQQQCCTPCVQCMPCFPCNGGMYLACGLTDFKTE